MTPAVITIQAADLELNGVSKGTVLSLANSRAVSYFLIKGTATLSSNLSINFDTTGAPTGTRLIFEYHAAVTLNSNTLTIAGKSIPARLTSSPMTISVIYDGTNTVVNILASVEDNKETISNTNIVANSITAAELATGSVAADEIAADAVITAKILNANVTAAKLATDSVSTVKIANGAVHVEKLENEALQHQLFIPVHFDYSAKDSFYFAIPVKCSIVSLVATVSGTAIGATHAATMTINNETSGSALLSTGTLHAHSAAEGAQTLISLSNTSVSSRDVLRFTPDGSQTAGKIFIALGLQRVAD